jgi:hypothetical protein
VATYPHSQSTGRRRFFQFLLDLSCLLSCLHYFYRFVFLLQIIIGRLKSNPSLADNLPQPINATPKAAAPFKFQFSFSCFFSISIQTNKRNLQIERPPGRGKIMACLITEARG